MGMETGTTTVSLTRWSRAYWGNKGKSGMFVVCSFGDETMGKGGGRG